MLDGLSPDDLTAGRVYRTLDGPRPPICCLAHLIRSATLPAEAPLLPDEQPKMTPAQARYSHQQKQRKARQRAEFLGLVQTARHVPPAA